MSELKLMAKYDGQEIPAKAWREIVMLRQECSKQQARIKELEGALRWYTSRAEDIAAENSRSHIRESVMEALFVELSLDAGNRGKALLTTQGVSE